MELLLEEEVVKSFSSSNDFNGFNPSPRVCQQGSVVLVKPAMVHIVVIATDTKSCE